MTTNDDFIKETLDKIMERSKPKSYPKGVCYWCDEPAVDYCINCDRPVCKTHCSIDPYDRRPYCPICI